MNILPIPVNDKVKRELQRLAKKRGMSLYEFCALVLAMQVDE